MSGHAQMRHLLGTTAILFIVGASIFFIVRPGGNDIPARSFGKEPASEERQILGEISGFNHRVKKTQEVLQRAGFQPGPIDGEMGPRTREAIRRFQKAGGLSPTGYVDFKTWAEVVEKRKPDLTSELLTPVDLEEETLRVETENAITKADVQDDIMSYRLKSKERTKNIQLALKRAGFDPGEIDGKIGPKTKQAIMAFQQSKRLRPDGVVGVETWEKLKEFLEDQQ